MNEVSFDLRTFMQLLEHRDADFSRKRMHSLSSHVLPHHISKMKITSVPKNSITVYRDVKLNIFVISGQLRVPVASLFIMKETKRSVYFSIYIIRSYLRLLIFF